MLGIIGRGRFAEMACSFAKTFVSNVVMFLFVVVTCATPLCDYLRFSAFDLSVIFWVWPGPVVWCLARLCLRELVFRACTMWPFYRFLHGSTTTPKHALSESSGAQQGKV